MSRNFTVPEWLNESFLQTVLQQDECLGREVKVKGINAAPAVAAGSNYACVLYRVRGEYQTQDDPEQVKGVSVIVKFASAGDVVGKSFGDSPEKEFIAYKQFLPQVYKVLKGGRFTSKLLYSPDGSTMVLEDLKDQGFVMADRLKQLDFEHSLFALKCVAKFHAASVAVINKSPQFIKTLGKETMYDRHNKMVYERNQEMVRGASQIFIKAVQNWGGIEDFENRSQHVWETLLDDVCDFYEARKDSLNVMNHGDLWTGNIMFKYDSEENIADLRLIDFQSFRYTTPAVDILYFLFSSVKPEIREKRMDELLSAYLESLNSTLEEFDCEQRLTKEQLDEEVRRSRPHILWITVTILVAALNDPDDLPNLDEVTEENLVCSEDNPFEKCYYGKYYTKIARNILQYLDKEGFFEKVDKGT